MPAQPRPYRQVARAASARGTHWRIVDAFADAIRRRWLDEITLDDVATAAGTTRQTIIRLFGGKNGLLAAVAERTGQEAIVHRALGAEVCARAIARAVVQDYEASGDMVLRLLAQEGRHPELTALLDMGRREHRRWVRDSFAPWLAAHPDPAAEALLDQLVVATDVYTWKLLRRDRRHPPSAVEALVTDMLEKLLSQGRDTDG